MRTASLSFFSVYPGMYSLTINLEKSKIRHFTKKKKKINKIQKYRNSIPHLYEVRLMHSRGLSNTLGSFQIKKKTKLGRTH